MTDSAAGTAPGALRRRYVPAPRSGPGQVHLRAGGRGPAVLLLPDVPGSGAALARLGEALVAAGHAVAVVDLVGAGGTTCVSEPGDLHAQSLLAQDALEALGWNETAVVGDGAGAAVGLRLAADRPGLVTGLAVLAAPYAGAEPVPDWDATLSPHGEHLVRLWHELRDAHTFSPSWQPASGTRRRRPSPTAAALHEVFADTLPHVPSHRRLAEAVRRGWPALVARTAVPLVEVATGGDTPAVLACLRCLPAASASSVPDAATPAGQANHGGAPPTAAGGGADLGAAPTRGYVEIGHDQLHLRACAPHDLAGRALPMLLLHANPGSAQGLEPLLRELGQDRLALAADLPGHGRSDPLPVARRSAVTLAGTYVPVLLRLLDAVGIDRVDIYGTHTGAGLAVELAVAAPDRVRCLVLDGVPLFDDDPDLVASVLAGYFADLSPDEHGSHLVRAWNITWDMALWWPWFRRDMAGIRDNAPYRAEMLQRVTADLLRSLPSYAVSYRAAWTWQGSRRLPLVRQPVLVGSGPTDPLRALTPRALALLPHATEDLFPAGQQPGAAEGLARRIRAFVDGVPDGR